MKVYNNGQRKSMMYGGAAKRKPMMYGGSMKKSMGHGGMTEMSAKPKKMKAPMPMMGAMNNTTS